MIGPGCLAIGSAVVVGVAVVAISALIYGYVDAMRQVREAQNASRDLWREAWDARKETWQAQDDSRAAQEKAEQLAKKVAEVQEEAMQAQGEVESLQEKVVQAQKEALQTRKQWRQTKAEAAQIFGKVSRAKLDLQMAESECDHAHDVVDGVLADLAKLREKLDESKLGRRAVCVCACMRMSVFVCVSLCLCLAVCVRASAVITWKHSQWGIQCYCAKLLCEIYVPIYIIFKKDNFFISVVLILKSESKQQLSPTHRSLCRLLVQRGVAGAAPWMDQVPGARGSESAVRLMRRVRGFETDPCIATDKCSLFVTVQSCYHISAVVLGRM